MELLDCISRQAYGVFSPRAVVKVPLPWWVAFVFALGAVTAESVVASRSRSWLVAQDVSMTLGNKVALASVATVGAAKVASNASTSATKQSFQDPCDCTYNSTMACCGTNPAVLRGRLESSAQTLKEYAAAEREQRLDANGEELKLLRELLALKDQEMEYKAQLAARNASYVTAAKIKSDQGNSVAVAAAQAAQAARLEAAKQYAALDAARAAREVAGAVRVEEVGKANGAIDTAASAAVKAVSDSTKDVVEKTAYAANAATMAKVAQEAASNVAEKARTESVRAKVAAASAAAAQIRLQELEQAAKESAEAALSAEAAAQQDRIRAEEASAALAAMSEQALKTRDEASQITEAAARELAAVASAAIAAVEQAGRDASKVLNDAKEGAIQSALLPTSTLPADPLVVAETPTRLPRPPTATPSGLRPAAQSGDLLSALAGYPSIS
eukprot:TRINITY_DN69142_c0_g1_i1.p1 TRINITY_DN69142_c0_g1~~TRINITY_DN69142_c0_g1_i1.p1  ORF type:complete len:444 (-),score=110.18 TRINITY_DN69142_c0_g1_i1:204-1535(-)